MDFAKIAKAEKLLDEITEMLTSGNHSVETLTALVKLRDSAGPVLKKAMSKEASRLTRSAITHDFERAATRETLDSGNVIADSTLAAERSRLGLTLESDASGALTTVTTLDELLASWDTRLANAVKNAAPHPIAKQRAYDEELLRMMKELRTLQNTNAAIQAAMPIRDVSAEMAALKSDGEKSTMDLIKEAQRNSTDGRSIVCFQ